MGLEFSHVPVACGFLVAIMSPLGWYPNQSVVLEDAALVVSNDFCYSVVRIASEDWGFSEVDNLSP